MKKFITVELHVQRYLFTVKLVQIDVTVVLTLLSRWKLATPVTPILLDSDFLYNCILVRNIGLSTDNSYRFQFIDFTTAERAI